MNPLGDEQSANDVAGGGDDGDGAQYRGECAMVGMVGADQCDRAQHGDGVQRIGQ